MNSETQAKIREAVSFLNSELAQKCKPYLHDALILALDLVDCVTDEWQTSHVIADRLFATIGREIDQETVNQVLNACKAEFNLESKSSKHYGWRRK